MEGSLLSSGGGPGGIVVPTSPLRSVAAALGSNIGVSVGQGQGLGLEKSGSARMTMGRSPTLSVSGAAATGAAGPNSAAVAPAEGGELDVETPRTLGSILPTSRAKEAKAAAEAAAAAVVAATSPLPLLRSASAGAAVLTSQQAAGLLPPAVAVAALPLRVPLLPSSAATAVAAEELVVVQVRSTKIVWVMNG